MTSRGAGPGRERPLRAIGDLFAWLAGARRSVLKQCPSERPIYAQIGAMVLVTVAWATVAATFTLADVTHRPVREIWQYGLMWGFIILAVERMLQMTVGSRKKSAVVAALSLRVGMSLVICLLVAELLCLVIFARDISPVVAAAQEQDKATQTTAIEARFRPQLNTLNADIAGLQTTLNQKRTTLAYSQMLAACESGLTTCSTSHRLGQGPLYNFYTHQAQVQQADLQKAEPTINGQIQDKQNELGQLNTARLAAEQSAATTIDNSAGPLTRTHALWKLAFGDAAVLLKVILVGLLFVLIDMIPVLGKVTLLRNSAHDQINAAAKELEQVEALRLREEAHLQRSGVTRRREADEDVDRVVVNLERERRIDEAERRHAEWAARPGDGHPFHSRRQRRAATEENVQAASFSQFVNQARAHEHATVPLDPRLTRGAWIGTALLAGLGGLLGWVGTATPGFWLTLAAVLGAAGLAARTHGFRAAPAWGHRAAFGTALAGLALPLVVLALNL